MNGEKKNIMLFKEGAARTLVSLATFINLFLWRYLLSSDLQFKRDFCKTPLCECLIEFRVFFSRFHEYPVRKKMQIRNTISMDNETFLTAVS